MAVDRQENRGIDLQRLLSWTLLFRAGRIAADPFKIVLGAVSVVALAAGWWALGWWLLGAAPTAPMLGENATRAEVMAFEKQVVAFESNVKYRATIASARAWPWEKTGITPTTRYSSILQSHIRNDLRNNVFSRQGSAGLVLEPIYRYAFPFRMMFENPGYALAGVLFAIWTLVVAGLVGGAISRMAAIEIARDGSVGLVTAIRFVVAHARSYLLAPVLPLVIVLIAVICCAIGGALAWIPVLDIVMGLMWWLALLAGAAMAALLLGLAIVWPLIYPAISVEATESMDALTRSYGYLLGKPWNFIAYWVIALVYGGLLMIVATTLAFATVKLSQYGVAWGRTSVAVESLYSFIPAAGLWRESLVGTGADVPTGITFVPTALLVGFWTHLLFLALAGFAVSYFWSAATAIYFLLRRDVDETEIDEVYLEEDEEEPFPTAPTTPAPTTASAPGLQVIDRPEGSSPASPASPASPGAAPAAPSFPPPTPPSDGPDAAP